MTGLAAFFAGMFSHSKVQDTALDAVRKLGGLDDLNHKEKAQFILDYIQGTKHQSPIRRIIAFMLSTLYVGVVLLWIVAAGVGYYFNVVPSLEFAGAVKMMMTDTIVQPFNIILAFYFVTNIVSRVGK